MKLGMQAQLNLLFKVSQEKNSLTPYPALSYLPYFSPQNLIRQPKNKTSLLTLICLVYIRPKQLGPGYKPTWD